MPHEQEKGEIENLILPEYNQGKEAHLIKYKDYVFITAFKQILKQIPTFAIRDDDIWVVSYPKSGNYLAIPYFFQHSHKSWSYDIFGIE